MPNDSYHVHLHNKYMMLLLVLYNIVVTFVGHFCTVLLKEYKSKLSNRAVTIHKNTFIEQSKKVFAPGSLASEKISLQLATLSTNLFI